MFDRWTPKLSVKLSGTEVIKNLNPLRERGSPRTQLFHELVLKRSLMSKSPSPLANEKRVRDTFVQVFLPFKDNPSLLNEYLNVHGGIRVGKILEDLDALAAAVSFLYLEDRQKPEKNIDLTVVTAAVDHIEIDPKKSIITGRDVPNLKLSGIVSFAGNTSLEVSIFVDSQKGDNWDPLAQANFIMVARNTDGSRPSETLLPLVARPEEAEGQEEMEVIEKGKIRNETRKKRRETSLDIHPPTAEESSQIHKLFKGAKSRPPNAVPVTKTKLQSTTLCHPQERNIHNRIFGGFLMREAFELAFTAAVINQRSQVEIAAIDDILFVEPVEIGSILQLGSKIVFTNETSIQVQVIADVLNIESGDRKTTNTFYFTFVPSVNGEQVRQVYPETYQEAMEWLQAQRRLSNK
jgi:acyl-coenzyme A thioesterase 9